MMGDNNNRRVLTRVQIVLVCVAVVAFAWVGVKLFGYQQAQQSYNDIKDRYGVQAEEGQCPVDLRKLMQDYPETVGWIQMDDLDISYPVMQGEDNDKYLHVDSHGDESIDGSVFLDYRNNPTLNERHVLVYGHNMLDGSMFGTLSKYTDEGFYREGAGTFTYFTVNGAYRYQIFAVDIVNPDDEIYQTGYQNAEVFDGFVRGIQERSMYDTGVDVTGNDSVMTLSTCSDADRLVVSAKRLS